MPWAAGSVELGWTGGSPGEESNASCAPKDELIRFGFLMRAASKLI